VTTPKIQNFRALKLDNSKGALDLARTRWADADFVPNDEYWLGHFEIGDETHAVGIRAGHRKDVAPDILQYSFQLDVREVAFEKDRFMPESEVAEILAAVPEEFYRVTGLVPPPEKASLDNAMRNAIEAILRGDRLIIEDSKGAVVYTRDGDDPKRTVLLVRVDPAEFERRDSRKALDDAHAAYLATKNKQ
jgi:hypothetical protein